MEIEIPTFQEFRGTSDGPLHVAFIVHLVLSSWSMLGFWSGNKLLLHDSFFLLCMLWGIHNQGKTSPIILALVIDCLSVILDIIVLAVWYPHEAKSSEQFSAVMAIFNLIFRFASVYVLYQCWRERNDALNGIYGTTNPTTIPAQVTTTVRSPSRVSQRAREVKDEVNGNNGYGYAPGPVQPQQPPRPELPPIPPSYTLHA